MSAEFRLGDWLVQPQLNQVRLGRQCLRIEPQVMDLLVYMAERPDEVLHKDRIIEAVWERSVGDDVLTHGIFELRKALGDDARNPRFIETIPRRGYRLIAPVQAGGEADEGERHPSGRRNLGWGWAWVVVAGALLAVLAGRFGWFEEHSRQISRADEIRSLAVLPLRNLSGDPEQEYFADGMTEMLITTLAKTGLSVPSATSSMYYKGREEKPLAAIARELKVDAVLEGSALQADGRVLVNLQLIDAATDRHLWAQEYERELVDVLALLQEVSLHVARGIDAHVAGSPAAASASQARKVDPEAYDHYLKGLFFQGGWAGGNLESSVRHYQQSIAKQPDYAPSYVGLASAYSALAFVHALPQRETYENAREAARKALRIDGANAEAWAVLGSTRLFTWDWVGAGDAMRRALQLNRNNPRVHDRASYFYMANGRHDESVEEVKRAWQLDPFSMYTNLHVGWALYMAGRHDEAIAHLQSTKELFPESAKVRGFLAQAFEAKGLYREAMAERRCDEDWGFVAPRESSNILGCPLLHALNGRRDEALRVLKELLAGRDRFRPLYVAQVFAALGDADSAFEQLEIAYRERDSDLVFLESDPPLASLRADPRFTDLLRRVKRGG